MIAPLNDAAVHTEGLTKVYKDFWGRDKVRALDDLNLTINRGEVFGLLGPNGSGKSTTIKLLLGLIFPSRGTATILGRPAGDTGVNADTDAATKVEASGVLRAPAPGEHSDVVPNAPRQQLLHVQG